MNLLFQQNDFIENSGFLSKCICLNLPCMECGVEGLFLYYCICIIYCIILIFLTVDICLGQKCMTTHVWDYSSFGHVFFFSPCSLDRPISKRCASLSTCVLGKLSQELHKLQTYPRTDVGAGTPGKKRNVLNDLDHERYANYGETLGNN